MLEFFLVLGGVPTQCDTVNADWTVSECVVVEMLVIYKREKGTQKGAIQCNMSEQI